MQSVVMAVSVNYHAASYLNVLDRGRGVTLDELGFSIKLHGLDRAIAGLYRNRVFGYGRDRAQHVFHAAVSEGQSAYDQCANKSCSQNRRMFFHHRLLKL